MPNDSSKPGDQSSDAQKQRSEKASENLAKTGPELNASNLRSAQRANQNRTDTVSPDGKSRFSLTDDTKSNDKHVKAVQEKAYRDAGLGDPHKPIGKPSESGMGHQKITEQAAKALSKIMDSGKTALSEGAKLWQGAHNGMHELVDESVKSVGVARDYYVRAISGKVNFIVDVKDFANAASKDVSQSLGTAGDYYSHQVPKGEANLVKDIATASTAAADQWNAMDMEQKGQFIGKELVPFLVPGAIGVVAKEVQGTNLVAKTGEAITAFSGSEKVVEMEQKMAQLQGRVQKMTQLGKPLEPAYAAVSDGPGRRPILPQASSKGDNYLAMSKAEGGEDLPKRPRDGREREPIPEKIAPSEAFEAELNQAADRLSEQEKDFLREKKIEIKAVYRITDVPGTDERMGGCFRPNENTIYVPEQLYQKGGWAQNNDLEFILRHEFGHAFNANKLQFGHWLSNEKRFTKVFAEEFNKIPQDMKDTLMLSEKFKPLERAREEAFADMFAHASGLQSNNPYSQLMKKYFPSCLKYLEDMPKW